MKDINETRKKRTGFNNPGPGHRIYARHSGVPASDRLQIPVIKRCIRAALCVEGVDKSCEVSVLITNARGIRKINREFRGIDEPTDVLSFPMHEFSPPGWGPVNDEAIDPETGLLPLGDIILSAEHVAQQAKKYYQTKERETAYLTVHSVLHLLGYDHIDEAEQKKLMRKREEKIMENL